CEQNADIGGNALAALELEPHWKEVADEGAEAGGERKAHIVGARECEHGNCTLERIAEQRRGRKPLAPGAQHVGGADIAGADVAQVLGTGRRGEDEAERNGAEQIAECEGGEEEHGLPLWRRPAAAAWARRPRVANGSRPRSRRPPLRTRRDP